MPQGTDAIWARGWTPVYHRQRHMPENDTPWDIGDKGARVAVAVDYANMDYLVWQSKYRTSSVCDNLRCIFEKCGDIVSWRPLF